MPPTTRASVKSPAKPAVVGADPASLSEARARTLAIPPTSKFLYHIVVVLPLLALALTMAIRVRSTDLIRQLAIVIAMSVGAYLATRRLIPVLQHFTLKKGMWGIDLNKPGTKEEKSPVPEALGVVSGVVYMISIICVQLLYSFSSTSRCELVEINAALHSICFMLFLGFADDVVDLPWRYKLILPTIATLPLLIAYGGGTHIIVPKPFRAFLPSSIDLGFVYKLYMLLLSVFTTNAINILAGINGLEAGQSFIIAIAIAIHNVIELSGDSALPHVFSLFLVLPFLGSVLGLLHFNWYPSRVFVGDTFTTQAGMTFAVVGILGHFSKTLLLFFIPQIVNFLISLPQILGLFGLTCPRHRLPAYDERTGRLVGKTINHNLVNLVLLVVGPMREEHLCCFLLALQVVCCAMGFWVRYYLAKFFY